MGKDKRFTVKIDQLPEEEVFAPEPTDAALKVRELLKGRESLRALHRDEPVQLKRPDGRPWGRNLSISHYMTDLIETDDEDGPFVEPTIQQI